jgi:hypothetical protein
MIPAHGRLRQEDHKFEVSLGNKTLIQKTKQNKTQGIFSKHLTLLS